MKGKELKNKEGAALHQMLADLRAKMVKLGFELEANTLKNVSDIKKTRRDVARILTRLNLVKDGHR